VYTNITAKTELHQHTTGSLSTNETSDMDTDKNNGDSNIFLEKEYTTLILLPILFNIVLCI